MLLTDNTLFDLTSITPICKNEKYSTNINTHGMRVSKMPSYLIRKDVCMNMDMAVSRMSTKLNDGIKLQLIMGMQKLKIN